MHGFIVTEIKKFVEHIKGPEAWPALLNQAGFKDREYLNFLEYPDSEVVGLVGTASEMTGLSIPEVLTAFGEFLGQDLMKIYRPLIQKEWRTLEFLENIEETIHGVVRSRNRQAKPPTLQCQRVGLDEVLVVYRSKRQMCHLAVGIATGVAKHYNEEVSITQDTCMHNGDQACQIRVRLESEKDRSVVLTNPA